MRCAILTIGNEITRGELVDTNAVWLSEQMTQRGGAVLERGTVRDEEADIVRALRDLAERHELILTTGGLGPTSDDLTAAAVAKAAGKTLELHRPSLEAIEKRWERRGRPMPPANVSQAELPSGCDVLPNPNGTAPGFGVQIGSALVYTMPGVPREMKPMFEQQVLPRIQHRLTPREASVKLRCFGLPESELADKLKALEEENQDIEFGYRVKFPEIEVRVTAHGDDVRQAQARAEDIADKAREILGTITFGDGLTEFPEHVSQALMRSGKRVALAESCTGGLLGELLTRTPGSSQFLVLSAVTYANEAKQKLLGVPEAMLEQHGAVSKEVAIAMAEGALHLGEADIAIAITGIAGPDGGSEAKPIGTVYIASAERTGVGEVRTETQRFNFDFSRAFVRTLSAYCALDLLRHAADSRLPGGDGAGVGSGPFSDGR